jgi:hypothetical protein
MDIVRCEVVMDLESKYLNFFYRHWVHLIAGVFMIVGIILSFFYLHLGGALVGLATGVGFFDELQRYFFHARDYAIAEGLFKTLLLVGVLLFLLLSATAFVIAVVISFVVMSMIHLFFLRNK